MSQSERKINMLIDWFTVLAQVINFLVLVFLLKRFLYGPITKAMDEREAKIAANMVAAEQKAAEAKRAAEDYQLQVRELARKREALLQQAQQESEMLRKELDLKVRQEAAEVRQRWLETLQHEKDNFLLDLRLLASEKIFAMARHALKSLANTKLENQIIETFIERLAELEAQDLQELAQSLREAGGGFLIQSAFPIQEAYRQRLVEVVHQQLGEPVMVQFELVPELIGGIILKGYHYETAWNLDSYWRDLEASLVGALDKELVGKYQETPLVTAGAGA
jgi:F-type H+-transporting ATPase subunit b